MYIAIVFILSIFSVVQLNKNSNYINKSRFVFKHRHLFVFLIIVFTSILCVRYGQGTDYLEYLKQYESIDSSRFQLTNSLSHGEIGWYILLLVGNKLGLTFTFFIAIISIIMMLSISRAIIKYSPYPLLSLLIFYPTYYLTYCFSAIRQGLVLCIFLGFCIDFILNKKYFKYYLFITVLALFHTSAVLLFLAPFVKYLKRYNEKLLILTVLILSFIGSAIFTKIASLTGVDVYMEQNSSIPGIIVRIILFYLIYTLHKYNSTIRCIDKYKDLSNISIVFYNIYFMGFLVFLLLASTATLSQRMSMPLKAIELLLFPIEFYLSISYRKHKSISRKPMLRYVVILLLIINVETVKNLYSYIDQGQYQSWVTPLNYPLITIFNTNSVNHYR